MHTQRTSLCELSNRDGFNRSGAKAVYQPSVVHDETVADVDAVVKKGATGSNDVRSGRQLATAMLNACCTCARVHRTELIYVTRAARHCAALTPTVRRNSRLSC